MEILAWLAVLYIGGYILLTWAFASPGSPF
jgi:hypothetical protein